MNILPFVTVFLIILAIFSSSSLKDYKVDVVKKNTIIGSIQAERSIRHLVIEKIYQKAPKKNLETIASKKEDQSKKIHLEEDYLFSRDDLERHKKLNLSPLFTKDHQPLLEELYAKAIEALYGHNSFYTRFPNKKLSQFLLKSLIDKAQNLLKDNPNKKLMLTDLFPSDETLFEIYYKMLKGTQEYNLKMKKGYPPFSDFFTIDETKQKPIFFAGLSSEILEAFFGSEVKQKILEEEALLRLSQAKKTSLDETKFKDILHTLMAEDKKIDKLIEYFDFSKVKKTKLNFVYFEEKTHIKASKPAL